MRKFTVRDLTVAAIIAALYAVMGYFGNVFGLTFGAVQIRFAEALTVLPFLFPATAPGLAIGCLITNLLSPYGPIDVVLGTLASVLNGTVHPIFSIIFAKIVTVSKTNLLIFLTILNKV